MDFKIKKGLPVGEIKHKNKYIIIEFDNESDYFDILHYFNFGSSNLKKTFNYKNIKHFINFGDNRLFK